ncbi:MAG: hypothetical protein GX621_08505, partial [Pirellulaceae bacterium]|nr:hypothetical protein [Pirellulaceae bacterium]
MEKIAVLLHTCDRSEYTKQTIDGFLKQNDPSRFRLFMTDDASTEQEGLKYAAKSGFEMVYQTRKRTGCTLVLRDALQELSKQLPPETLLLYLQNDIEFVRPLSIPAVVALIHERKMAAVRLFADQKSYPGHPRYLDGHRRARFKWTEPKWICGELFGTCQVPWTHLPNVSTLGLVTAIMRNAKRESHA